MTPEKRRAILERVIARWRERGSDIEADPGFRAHVDEWIDGQITVVQLRERYNDLLRNRSEATRRLKSTEPSEEPQ